MLKPKAMRVRLTHGDLRSDFAIPAIVKLKRSPNYKVRSLKKMSEIGKVLDKTFELSQDAYVGLVKAYAVLDESGNIVLSKEKPGFTVPVERQEDWKKSYETFLKTELEVELPYGKMSLDEISKVGLTPEDLAAVPFIVE